MLKEGFRFLLGSLSFLQTKKIKKERLCTCSPLFLLQIVSRCKAFTNTIEAYSKTVTGSKVLNLKAHLGETHTRTRKAGLHLFVVMFQRSPTLAPFEETIIQGTIQTNNRRGEYHKTLLVSSPTKTEPLSGSSIIFRQFSS